MLLIAWLDLSRKSEVASPSPLYISYCYLYIHVHYLPFCVCSSSNVHVVLPFISNFRTSEKFCNGER
jgi:hypothetical protein